MVRDSLYTRTSMHPVLTGMVMVGASLLLANWMRSCERASGTSATSSGAR